MKILLNQDLTPLDLGNINPNTTVLEWLRLNGLVGSKEGCASGDCGACVAVVGIIHQDKINYKSVNTCIALMANIAGKHLITIEGIAENHKLHPVQNAMVAEHGSQCGFCTPGVVMSLFALYHNQSQIDEHKIKQALSGNLCRCTGYLPIINAAKSSFNQKTPDYFERNQVQIIKSLKSITHQNKLSAEVANYYSPQTSQQLAEIIVKQPNAKIIAGGTDLSLEITQSMRQFTDIVSINEVADLHFIRQNDEIEIGAAVSFSDAWDVLIDNFPSLENFLNRFASLPIRNFATIVGNIANASPIGDMPPVLLALDAKLRLSSLTNNKLVSRLVKLEDFYLDYKTTILNQGEFIASVLIPKLINAQLIVHKISKRFEDDISAVCLAMKLKTMTSTPEDIRIAVGGMAAVPKILALTAKTAVDNWHSDNLAKLCCQSLKQELNPLSDVRATSEYRLQVTANLIQKTKLQIIGQKVVDLSANDYQAVGL